MEEVVGMCFEPTKDEITRSQARRTAEREDHEQRRDPSAYPEPRGNQTPDEDEVERSRDKLEAVLGH
ncbi:MAG: hypothetical protein H0V08_02485 [Thermoleophilaceae bacterium]|nr:hypothetical protein [Thermoleophilaceae bacterium]